MTLFEPTIILNRLIVESRSKIVFDESFRHGVNILRGGNSTGKTTLSNLIFYVLGGENVVWTEEALMCNAVIAEVQLNSETITFRREISGQQSRPLDLFWGNVMQSREAQPSEWKRYPFASAGGKESFSTVLFRALGMPRVRGELDSQITMNSILRVIYADQKSPHDAIFRLEHFDSALKREMVGLLLCGVYDREIYDLELQQRDVRAQIDLLNKQLDSLVSVLRATGEQVMQIEVAAARQKLEQDRRDARSRLDDIRLSSAKSRSRLNATAEKLKEELQSLKSEIKKLVDERDSIAFEIADSESFVESLQRRINSLQEAKAAWQALGGAHFRVCPQCFSPVADKVDYRHCPLCKSTEHHTNVHLLGLRQELAQQYRESKGLQHERRQRLASIEIDLGAKRQAQSLLENRYEDVAIKATSEAEAEYMEAYRHLGYLDRKAEDLERTVRLAAMYSGLVSQKESLAAELSSIVYRLEGIKKDNRDRRARVYSEISKATVEILHKDVGDEAAFRFASSVEFDFGADRVTVERRRNFSDSSLVFLRNAFRVGMLVASCGVEFMRFPRFLLLDSIEDKGMVPERSHNFQQLVVDISAKLSVAHQIILTTSMVHPRLRDSPYVVGRFFEADKKSLDI
jgi:rubrerythrin